MAGARKIRGQFFSQKRVIIPGAQASRRHKKPVRREQILAEILEAFKDGWPAPAKGKKFSISGLADRLSRTGRVNGNNALISKLLMELAAERKIRLPEGIGLPKRK